MAVWGVWRAAPPRRGALLSLSIRRAGHAPRAARATAHSILSGPNCPSLKHKGKQSFTRRRVAVDLFLVPLVVLLGSRRQVAEREIGKGKGRQVPGCSGRARCVNCYGPSQHREPHGAWDVGPCFFVCHTRRAGRPARTRTTPPGGRNGGRADRGRRQKPSPAQASARARPEPFRPTGDEFAEVVGSRYVLERAACHVVGRCGEMQRRLHGSTIALTSRHIVGGVPGVLAQPAQHRVGVQVDRKARGPQHKAKAAARHVGGRGRDLADLEGGP